MNTMTWTHAARCGLLAAMFLGSAAYAGSPYSWNTNSDGNWNGTSPGWNQAGAYPNAAGDVANLSLDINGTRIVTINVADAKVGTLNIQDITAASNAWTLATSNAVTNKLTLNNGASNAAINATTAAAVTDTISAPVVLAGNTDITVGGSVSHILNITGAVTDGGSQTLTKLGTGILELGNAGNSISTVTISAGTLVADAAGALGANTVNLATGAILGLSTTGVTYANGINVTGAGTATINGRYGNSGTNVTNTLGALSIGGQQLTVAWGGNGGTGMNLTLGAVTMSGSPTFTVNNEGSGNAGTVTLGAVGQSGGSHMLTMTNPAVANVLKLTAAGTYSGGTTVNTGTLQVAANYALGSGAIAINNNGVLQVNTNGGLTSSADNTTPLAITMAPGSKLWLKNTTNATFGSNVTTTAATGTVTIVGGNFTGSVNTLGTLTTGAAQTFTPGTGAGGGNTLNLGTVSLGGNTIFDIAYTSGAQNQIWTLGAVSGSGYSLTKNSNGTLILNASNSYSGGTVLNGGTLIAYGPVGTGQVTLNGGTFEAGVNYTMANTSITVPNASTLIADTAKALISSSDNTTPIAVSLTAGTGASGSGTYGGVLTVRANTTSNFSNNVTVTGTGTAYVNLGFATAPTKGGINQYLGALSIGAQTLSVLRNDTYRNGGSNFGPVFSSVTLTGNATFDVPTEGSGNAMVMGLGPISGGFGITKISNTGNGILALTGANSYTGPTTVTSGTLSLRNTGALAASSALSIASGAFLSLDLIGGVFTLPSSVTGAGTIKLNNTTLNIGDNINSGTFTGTIDTGSSTSGRLQFSNTTSSVPTVVLNSTNAVTLAATGGARTIGAVTNNSNASTYNVAAGNDLTLTSMTGVGSVGTTINIAAGTNLNFSAITCGNPGGNNYPSITVNGYGTLNLNSANTGFNVPQLNVGNNTMTRLNLNADNAVGASGGLGPNLGRITLNTRGTIGSTGAHTFANEVYVGGAGTYNFDVTNGNLAFDHIQAFNVNGSQAYINVLGTNALTLTNSIYQNANALNFTKIGPGTLVLAGTNATGYAGSTTVAGGTLILQAKNAFATAGGTIANGGTLQLDFNGLGGSNQTDIIKPASALTLAGGTLNLKGLTSNTNSQTFAGVTFNAGASAVTATQNGASGLSLALGAITARNVGSTVDFSLPTTGTVTTSSTTFVSNSVLVSAASNGVAFATVGGTDWAANSAGTIAALGSYSTGNANYVAASNIDVTNGDAPAAASTVNTLRFNAATDALTLAGINTVATGGILVTSAATNASTTGGTIKPGGGNQLVIINNGALNVGSIIADGGAASSLTVSGPGTTTLSNTNTYSGQTYVNGGVLSVSANPNLGAPATGAAININGGTLAATADVNLYNGTANANAHNIVIGNNGATLDVANTKTLTVAGVISGNAASAAAAGNIPVPSLTKTGTGTLTLLNANSFTGNTLVAAGTLKLANNNALQTSVLDSSGAGSLDFSPLATAPKVDGTVGAAPTIGGLIGAGNLTIPANTQLFLSPTTGTVYSYSGSLSGSGTLVKSFSTGSNTNSAGIQILTGSNSYTGGTVIYGGTLVLGGQATLGAATAPLTLSFVSGYSNGTGSVSTAVLDLGYGSQTVGPVTLGGGTIQNGYLTGTSYTVQGSMPTTISAALAGTGSLTKTGVTTLTLSGNNVYSGSTNINGGWVVINGYQNLGDSSATNTITMSGGAVLEQTYNTTNDLGVNRALTLTGNAVLQTDSGPNGTPGTLVVSGPVSLGGNTLTVRGNFGSNNIASGNHVISGQVTGSGALLKSWGGVLTVTGLFGSATYTGGTTVSGGNLRADPSSIPSSGNLSLNGGVWETYAATSLAPTTGTGSGTVQLAGYAGFSAYSPSGTTSNVNLRANSGAQLVWGSTAGFNPATLVLNESTANSQITLQNAVDLNSAARTIAVNANTAVLSGVVSDAGSGGSIIKIGAGTLTLNNANTYAGTTAVNRGTVIADTTTNANILSSSSSLALGGGTFRLTGRTGTAQSQTVAGLTLNPGTNVIDANNVAGATSTTLDLRGTAGTTNITRNAGGTVDFRASTGTFGTTAVVMAHNANNAAGVLGAWATVNSGADLAANDGSDKVVPYSGYSNIALGGAIADSVNTNYKISSGASGSITLGATVTNINTLTQKWTTAATVDTALKTLRLGAVGGILLTPGNQALTIGTAVNSGALTAGGADNTAGEIVALNNSSNTLTINAPITNNGSGSVSLTVAGTGTGATTLAATAGTTFTGGVVYSAAGDLNVNGAGALGTGPLVVNSSGSTNGLNLNSGNPSTVTVASLSGNAAGAIRMNGGVTLKFGTNNADSTYLGRITNSGNGAVIKTGTGTWTWGDATSSPNQPYGITVAQGTVNFGQNNMVSGLTIDPTQNNGGTAGATINFNNTVQSFGINFSNLTAGTWTINTGASGLLYTGSNSGGVSVTAAAGNSPTVTVNGNVFLATGTKVQVSNASGQTTTLEFTGTVTGAAWGTDGNNSGTTKFSGTTSNNLGDLVANLNGAPAGWSGGTLLLAKTSNAVALNGDVMLRGGTIRYLQPNQLADTSNLTVMGGTFDFNSNADTVGSLTWSNAGTVSNVATLGLSSTGTALTLRPSQNVTMILGSGTSTINLTGASGGDIVLDPNTVLINQNRIPSLGSAATDTLNLGAVTRNVNVPNINTVAQTAAGVAYDAVIKAAITGTGGLTKTGVGTLQFNAVNSYAGDTTVAAGTLKVGVSNALPSGPGKGNVVLNGGATAAGALDLNNFDLAVNGLAGSTGAVPGTVLNNDSAALRTFTVGNGDATSSFAGVITDRTRGTGTLALTKVGSGTQTLSGTNSYSGATSVNAGTLIFNGNQSAVTGLVTVSPSATLGGSGTLGGMLAGGGLVSPGSSPGILTAAAVNPAGGLDFGFEFMQTGTPVWSNAGASGNDVLRLTQGSAPFAAALTSGNVVNIYFQVASVSSGDVFRGAFFTDLNTDFSALVSEATYNYYVSGNGAGSDTMFNGTSYYTLANYMSVAAVSAAVVQVPTANFSGGTISNGWIQEFTLTIPEPASAMLLALAGGALALRRRR